MKLALLSDTHGRHRAVTIPSVDVAIHCGDFTKFGKLAELKEFVEWFNHQPARYRILISGNHDRCTYRGYIKDAHDFLADAGVNYLEDSEVTIEGVRFYGSPWTPMFLDWSWMMDRGQAIKTIWDRIPLGIDVLVTHGPPMGKLDWSIYSNEHVGCADLREAVKRIQPRLHCFGHIHHSYGAMDFGPTAFVNCSICDEDYHPTRQPIIFDLEVSNESYG